MLSHNLKLGGRGKQSLSSSLVSPTELVAGQTGICRETMSQKMKRKSNFITSSIKTINHVHVYQNQYWAYTEVSIKHH